VSGAPFSSRVPAGVPAARGDLLWGIYRGLQEQVDEDRIGSLPRLVAVDPFARLSCVLAGDDYRANFAGSSPLVSINGPTVTDQSVAALEGSHGRAVAVDADQAIADQVRLALEGLYLELSSAASLSALRVLKSHDQSICRAVLVGTSSGYKEETRRT
jgi:threonine synthase